MAVVLIGGQAWEELQQRGQRLHVDLIQQGYSAEPALLCMRSLGLGPCRQGLSGQHAQMVHCLSSGKHLANAGLPVAAFTLSAHARCESWQEACFHPTTQMTTAEAG